MSGLQRAAVNMIVARLVMARRHSADRPDAARSRGYGRSAGCSSWYCGARRGSACAARHSGPARRSRRSPSRSGPTGRCRTETRREPVACRGCDRQMDRSARSGAQARRADRWLAHGRGRRRCSAAGIRVAATVGTKTVVGHGSSPRLRRYEPSMCLIPRPRPPRRSGCQQVLPHLVGRVDPEQREPRGEHGDDALYKHKRATVSCRSFWIMKRKCGAVLPSVQSA